MEQAHYMPYPSEEQLKMTFAASCIDSVAKVEHSTSEDVFFRMKRAGLIGGYVLKYYDTLHTESRDHVTQELVRMLKEREEQVNA